MGSYSSSKSFFGQQSNSNSLDEEEYSLKDIKKRGLPKLSRRMLLLIIMALLISGILYITCIHNQPNNFYNREWDTILKNFTWVSPAARRLPKSGQLFCWVQTAKMYHDTRAIAVNETWLNRCDHGQFFTSDFFNDTRIPYSTVFAGIPESYYNLFYKSRYAFYHIYQHISKDFDWYLKADDDTYIIVEHLRQYLNTLDPSKPYFLGHVLKPYLSNGYNAGGAGYVLSRAALKIFAEELYHNETLCPDDIYEDVGIGRCLSNAGIYPHDTRTSDGQNRFNTHTPAEVFHGSKSSDEYAFYKEKKGFEAFASEAISFHHLSPDELRLFDILLYRVNTENLNKKINSNRKNS